MLGNLPACCLTVTESRPGRSPVLEVGDCGWLGVFGIEYR